MLEALALAAAIVLFAAIAGRLLGRRRAPASSGPIGPSPEPSGAGPEQPAPLDTPTPPEEVAAGERAAAALRPLEAVDHWRAALAKAAPTSRADWIDATRWELAAALREVGRFGEAEGELRRIRPDSAVVLVGDGSAALGEMAAMMGRLDAGERQLEAARSQPRRQVDDGWLDLQLGLVARDRGDLDVAAERFRAARESTGPLAAALLAQVAVRSGDPAEAGVHLIGAGHASDPFAKVYLDIVEAEQALATGDAVQAAERASAARTAFAAAGLAPYEAEATWLLGRALAAAGRTDAARVALQQARDAYAHLGFRAQPPAIEAELAGLP